MHNNYALILSNKNATWNVISILKSIFSIEFVSDDSGIDCGRVQCIASVLRGTVASQAIMLRLRTGIRENYQLQKGGYGDSMRD